ncbi:MAG: sigma factor-like helix-turn-helix DNA-binding protein [Solirubrobacterales bacterium]
MSSGTEGVGQTTAGLGPAAVGLTKRQREVMERLELGYSVKQIATDTGVSRAAVYQTIERLRRQGAVAETFTPSGAPARGASGGQLPAGPLAAAPRESRLSELRDLAGGGAGEAARAEAIEGAIASGDVAALAYELGRADAEGREDMTAKLAFSALRRLGAVRAADTQSAEN